MPQLPFFSAMKVLNHLKWPGLVFDSEQMLFEDVTVAIRDVSSLPLYCEKRIIKYCPGSTRETLSRSVGGLDVAQLLPRLAED
jgi:hypothetical protein